MAKPILKWAGGKTQLLKTIEAYLPASIQRDGLQKYAEPFIGGGALFFYLKSKYSIKKAYLSDINEELVLMYKIVQSNVNELIEELSNYSDLFFAQTNQEEQSNLYYTVRDEFNKTKTDIDYDKASSVEIKRVAQLIFLNKTCFNGLYRVNKNGNFNVPFGKYNKPLIYDKDNLLEASRLLEDTTIAHDDYSNIPKEF